MTEYIHFIPSWYISLLLPRKLKNWKSVPLSITSQIIGLRYCIYNSIFCYSCTASSDHPATYPTETRLAKNRQMEDGSHYLGSRLSSAHHSLDDDPDLNLYTIWRKSSCILAPTPCLSINHDDVRLEYPNVAKDVAHETQRPFLVEHFFHPNQENQLAFKRTSPDPLSVSTLANYLFLHMSGFFICDEVYWIEFRLALFDHLAGETVAEHLFFCPGLKPPNLHRVCEQMLEIISQAAIGARASFFRLSLWPRTKNLLYFSHSMLSQLAVPLMMPSLDPSFL